jgi:hypothetical protein
MSLCLIQTGVSRSVGSLNLPTMSSTTFEGHQTLHSVDPGFGNMAKDMKDLIEKMASLQKDHDAAMSSAKTEAMRAQVRDNPWKNNDL